MDPFAKVTRDLVVVAHQKGLSDGAFRVLVALLTWASPSTPDAYPSEQTLATVTGKSVRTVKRAIAEIRSKLGVEVVSRKRMNGHFGNVYKLYPLYFVKPLKVAEPVTEAATTNATPVADDVDGPDAMPYEMATGIPDADEDDAEAIVAQAKAALDAANARKKHAAQQARCG